MPDFRAALEGDRVVLFDGAMGTEIYRRGVFLNRCYDDLCRTDPDLVREIHAAYREAGAEALETNSFGANRFRLRDFGLDGSVGEINRAAASLAREVAGGELFVAGSIGPLGVRLEPYGPTSEAEARGAFREQAEALAEGGADLFVLETFSDLAEVKQALAGCREAAELPVIALMTVQTDGRTTYGARPDQIASELEEAGADAVGLNCSVGPALLLDPIRSMARATRLPVAAIPNAGLPREVQGRKFYLAEPEYMASYGRKLVQVGARIVGGCCGTTPEHVREMANQIRAVAPRIPRVAGREPDREEAGHEPVPLADRSRWGRKLAAGEMVTSVEILPPKGPDPGDMLEACRSLRRAGVDAVNVPDGARAMMRMGVIAASALIEREAGIETVVHYCCRDRNLLGMMSDLVGAQALGLRNLLLITGDPPKMGPYPDATAVFDIDSVGLTNLVSALNRGLDLGGNPVGSATSFVIGVGVNPGAVDRERELERWYWKVDAGAEFAVTQPVFDLEVLVEFVAEIEKRGTRIPVVAGIWPLVSLRNAEFLNNEVPGIDVPEPVMQRMRRAQEKGKEHARAEGCAIAREMLEEVEEIVEGVQVSAPFGKVPYALDVFAALDGFDAARPADSAGAACAAAAASPLAADFPPVSYEIAFVFLVVAGALALFISERYPIDQVAIAIPVVLLVGGVITPSQAVSGLSSEATVTVACMLVLSLGLVKTGLVATIARWARTAPLGGPTARLLLFCLLVGLLSPFLNNTAVVVVFLPVFVVLAQAAEEPASLYLMPLSYSAILGGTVTLIGTSTNLIVYGMARDRGLDELGMFSIAPLGLVYLGAGLLYLFTLGRRWLPRRRGAPDLSRKYTVRDFVTELAVERASPAIGRTLAELRWGELYDVSVLGILRAEPNREIWAPGGRRDIREGDVLYVRGSSDQLLRLARRERLATAASRGERPEVPHREDTRLVEVLVAPGCPLVGQTLADVRFQQRYGGIVLAVQHHGAPVRGPLARARFEVGDLLLVHGPARALDELAREPGFVLLGEVRPPQIRPRAAVAAAIMAGVVVAAGAGLATILHAALVGVVLMVFTRCVRLEEIYAELDWMVVFLLAGLIPLGVAMDVSGAAEWMAAGIAGLLGPAGAVPTVAAFYLCTSLLTSVMSNNATAVVMTPVALRTALDLGMNPYALLVTVMFAASAGFATPFAYQTNAMIYAPGGYRFVDYLKVGVPLNLLLFLTAALFIPIFWPSA